MRDGRRPTTLDIARLAGVSRSTVSEVLNGRTSRFPQATADRVRSAASELGYHPSPAARSLVTGRSNLVVVLVPHVTFGSDLQDTIDRLVDVARARGRSLVVQFAHTDPRTDVEELGRLRPEAVVDLGILTDVSRALLQTAGTAVVPRAVDVRSDAFHREVGRAMARRLSIGTEPRQLVYVGLSDTRADLYSPLRYEGMRDQARASGLADPLRIDIALTLADVRDALAPVLDATGRIGLGCYNDAVATAALAACRAWGRDVPSDIAVIGVDGTPLGQLMQPRLTSVVGDMTFAELVLERELMAVLDGEDVPELVGRAPVLRVVEGDTA